MVKVVTIDFETYYEKSDYSLRNMPTAQYIHDPRFSIIGVAASINGGEPRWHSSDSLLDTKAFLIDYELEKESTLTVAHNALFDGAILEWQLGIKPWRYFCTMMGSRPTVTPFTGKMSLESVANYLDLGQKGNEVFGAHGKQLGDFSHDELLRYAAYCINDVVLCWKIFRHIIPAMPEKEMRLLDLTIKKFTRPQLRLDASAIHDALEIEKAEKALVLKKANLTDPGVLTSNNQFADILTNLGINTPTKMSPTTGKVTHAFAKSDPQFMALLTCGNPQVEALVEARLKWKSSINETRLTRFQAVAGATKDKVLAVPLLYYGAHPGRFSGLDKLNLQNMGRKSPLRKAIIAPPGYKVIAGDLSQIEARITAALAGQMDLLAAFAMYDNMESSDRDVYCEFGDKVFGRTITNTPADERERFIAKTGVLSLGFQAGAQKFYDSMKQFGIQDITFANAEAVVNTYRTSFPMIPELWTKMEQMRGAMLSGTTYRVGPVYSCKDRIKLPNGMFLTYPELTMTAGNHASYKWGTQWRDIYGGKLTENVVQALARIIMTNAELIIAKAGMRAALSVHDELIYVVKEDQVDRFIPVFRKILTAPVKWMPELPINCEINAGDNYGECK
ncbi:MAG: DNA polymerase [Nitrosomonadaceae bacterium]